MKINNVISIAVLIICGLSFNANASDCLSEDGCSKQLKKLRLFAKNGSADAQIIVAAMYFEGNQLKQSNEKAYRWYRRATRGSRFHPVMGVAHHEVGIMYIEGIGTDKNIEKGFKFLKNAAEAGYSKSQMTLGIKYFFGTGVDKDLVEARTWLTMAAENNNALAAYTLAEMDMRGLGGEKNVEQAIKWFRIAAAKGHIDAQQRLVEVSPKDATEYTQETIRIAKADKSAAKNSSSAKPKDPNASDSDNNLIIYREEMSEFEIIEMVVDKISDLKIYNGRHTTGSRIPGRVCGDGPSACIAITDNRAIREFFGRL